MKNYILALALGLLLVACDTATDKPIEQSKEKGWTPVDSNLIQDETLPDVTEQKTEADTVLSSFLPDKIYNYLGDVETQNANNTTNNGKKVKSVVRVYRNRDKMIAINVTEFSALTPDERAQVISFSFDGLKKLAKKKGNKIDLLNKLPNQKGVAFYSKSMNKSIMCIALNEEIMLTVNADCSLSFEEFKNIGNAINYKNLEKLKHII